MNIEQKKIWQFPWGYKESLIIVFGIIIVGFSLQTIIGGFNFYLLSYPFNIYLGIIILIFILISLIFKKKEFFKWFTSLYFSVSLLTAITLLSLILGITKQDKIINTEAINVFSLLGFKKMTSSWAFVFIYFLILLSLGAILVKRKPSFTKKYTVFFLNHLGLWIILFFAGLGYADINRYIMYVNVGETEWRVFDKENRVQELPIAIQLNKFTIEEYIPKLAIVNKKTSEILLKDKQKYFQIDTNNKEEISFSGYKIKLIEYIHNAVRGSDTTYKEIPMKSSSPAALIQVKNQNIEKVKWVSSGNLFQFPMILDIDSSLAIVMTPPEPKSFISNIEVYTKEGANLKAELRVNHPLRVGKWEIYQYGYDNKMGKMSSYSSFELVYDPWLNMVYIGIVLLGLGSLLLIIFGINYKK